MGVEIEKTSNKYIIRFEYRPHHLSKLKAMFPPRVPQWDHREKFWWVPLSQSALLQNYAAETKAIWKHDNVTEPLYAGTYDKVDLPDLDFDLPEYIFNREKKAKGEPFEVMEYQKKGIARGLKLGRFINGDQPGLGKTVQAIATTECQELLEKNTAFPCLIICPSSLKENWKREIKTWTGKDAMILETNVKHNYKFYIEAGLCQYVIVNYESLKKYFVEKFTNAKGERVMLRHVVFRGEVNMFKSVIIDEFHRVKLASTLQAVLTKGVCSGKKLVQGLTGTPVVNRPIDLCSQLSIIGRMGEIVGYKEFLARYCAGPRQASHLKELNALLTSTCFFRREKTEVLKDLPAKTRQVIVCDIDNRDEYNVAHRDLAHYMKEFMNATDKQIRKSLKGEVMVRIGILKRISAKGKLAAAVEHIKDMNSQGQKMVIFALEHTIVDALSRELPGLLKVTGRESTAEIEYNKDKFQNDPEAMNILVSLKCAEGHTLTASSYPFFIEIPWTFAACEQCEDRTHRVGQHDNVTAQYLLGHNTIDQRLYQIVLEKKSIAMDITGASDDVPESTMSLLIDLFNQKEAA